MVRRHFWYGQPRPVQTAGGVHLPGEEYIQFYNEVRPHQTLNYKTPQTFEDIYWERLTQK